MKKARILKLTKKEYFIYMIGVLALVATYASSIFLNSHISNTKINIEKIDAKIETQNKKNESLTMQVNELTSYDNVSFAIKDMGLAYNNENIVVITK